MALPPPKLTNLMGTIMLDDFLVRAGLAGVGLSLATGPLGAFVVWRRMAYFGDATAHAAILGVALALAADLPVGLGTLAVALLMAVTVATLAARGWAMDTTLGVLAHSALAFGLVAISFVHGVRTDLSAWLFGDILAVTRGDLAYIWGGASLVAALLIWRWSALLTATLNEDLAHASGLNPDRERLVLVLALRDIPDAQTGAAADPARRQRRDPQKGAQQRGFTRPVRPDDGHDLARFNPQ